MNAHTDSPINTGKLFFLVGPSGVGKDTVLDYLKTHHIANGQPLVAHRYITRPVRENDENHVQLSNSDFCQRKLSGLFLFDWQSHNTSYGIGKEVKLWLATGQNVIVNGSRNYLSVAQKRYPSLLPVWISVSEDILYTRLTERGRETPEEIEKRIQRNLQMETLKPKDCHLIMNDQSIEETAKNLIGLVKPYTNKVKDKEHCE